MGARLRLDDWENRLDCYIEGMRHKPFRWGDNDCLALASGAIIAQTGTDLFGDWFGTYRTEWGCLLNYKKQLKRINCCDIIEAVDRRMQRSDVWLPSRGSIVGRSDGLGSSVMSIAFGVVVSDKIAFLGYDGLLFEPVKHSDIFWGI